MEESDDFSFEYVFPTGPSIKKPLKCTDTHVIFDGYFRIESELPAKFPVRRILYRGDSRYLIQVTGIKMGKNTSNYFYDSEEEGMICLTPTEIIDLSYIVLEANITSEKAYELNYIIWREEDELRKMNEELYNVRMEKDITEMHKNRGIL